MNGAKCWMFLNGDPTPFRAHEAADLLLARLEQDEGPFLAVRCEYHGDDDELGTVRTIYVRAAAINAISPVVDIEG